MTEVLPFQLDLNLSSLYDSYRKSRDEAETPRLLSQLYGVSPQQNQSPLAKLASVFSSGNSQNPSLGQSSGQPGDYTSRVVKAETGSQPYSKNPNSSASGPYQFIDSTWLENLDKTYPQFAGLPKQEKLALRDDPAQADIQKGVFQAFTANNEGALRKAGVPIDDMSRYAAHFFGAGDASKVLNSAPDTLLESIVSPASIQANPFLKGMTVGQARDWLTSKMQTTAPGSPGAGFNMAAVGSPPLNSGMPANLRAALPELLRNPNTRAQAAAMAQQYINPEQWQMFRDDQGNLFQRNTKTGETKPVDKSGLLSPQEFKQKIELANAAGTKVTVDNRAETEEAKAIGKGAGERFNTTMAAYQGAGKRLQNLDRMEKMLTEVDQGKIQPARMNVSAWAKSLGLDDTVAERLGLDPKSVGTTQAVAALSNEMTLGHIGAGGIPANNFSNTDRQFVTEIVPKLGDDPESNRLKIEASRRLTKLEQEKGRELLAWRRNPANKSQSVDEFEAEWDAKLEKRDIFGDLVKSRAAQGAVTKPQGAAPQSGGNPYEAEMRRRGLIK